MRVKQLMPAMAIAVAVCFAVADTASAGSKKHEEGQETVKSNAGLGNGGEGPGNTGDGDLDPGNSGPNNRACRNAVTVQMSKGVGLFKPGRDHPAIDECGGEDPPS